MTPTTALSGIALLTHLGLAALVLHRAPRRPVNQVFALLLGWYGGWDLAEMLIQIYGRQRFAVKLLLSAGVVLPYLFAHFTALFPRRNREALVLRPGWPRWLLATPLFIVLAVIWSGAVPLATQRLPGWLMLNLGAWAWPVKLTVNGYLLLALWSLSRTGATAKTEFQRLRLRYTVVGLLLPAAAGSVFVLVGRWVMGHQGWLMYPHGVFPFFGLIMAGVLGVAILRFNLLGVDALIFVGVVYTLLTAALSAVLELTENALQAVIEMPSLVSTAIGTLVIAAVFSPLKDALSALVARWFGRREFDPVTVLSGVLARMRQAETLPAVLDTLLETTEPLLGFERAAIHLPQATPATGRLFGIPLPPAAGCDQQGGDPMTPGPAGIAADAAAGALAPAGSDSRPVRPATVAVMAAAGFDPNLPVPLPAGWSELDDLETLVETLEEDDDREALPYLRYWQERGYRHVFPVIGPRGVVGAWLLGAKRNRMPFSMTELTLVRTLAAEIPAALEGLELSQRVLAAERDRQQLEWTGQIYRRLHPDPDRRHLGGWPIRFHCRLSPQMKGDLIALHDEPAGGLAVVFDAAGEGIRAASALQAAHTGLRVMGPLTPLPRLQSGMATAVAALGDPELAIAMTLVRVNSAGVTVVSAGNPAPRLVSSGQVDRLGVAGLPAGGAGTGAPDDAEPMALPLAAGSLLVVVTAGVIRSLGQSGESELDALLMASGPAGIDAVHDALCRRVGGYPPRPTEVVTGSAAEAAAAGVAGAQREPVGSHPGGVPPLADAAGEGADDVSWLLVALERPH